MQLPPERNFSSCVSPGHRLHLSAHSRVEGHRTEVCGQLIADQRALISSAAPSSEGFLDTSQAPRATLTTAVTNRPAQSTTN